MELQLNIGGFFADKEELREVIRKRKICYDSEPYYTTHKGSLVQIGFQLNLYGTFSRGQKEPSPDDPEFAEVLRDVRKIAESLSQTCDPLHMCDATIVDSTSITYAHERKMRPDVTVHIPVFDQKDFGHPVDDNVRHTLATAEKILQAAGLQKTRWQEEDQADISP